MTAEIHQGTVVQKKYGPEYLQEMSYIFNCDECEYVGTTLTEEGAIVKRNTHNRTCHPKKHFRSMFEDFQERVKIRLD